MASYKRWIFLLLGCALVLTQTGCFAGKKQPTPPVAKKRYHLTHDEAPEPHEPPPNIDAIPDAKPVHMPKSKIGNPKTYTVFKKQYSVMPCSKGFKERGKASWYGKKFHGYKTSNGETYDMYSMSAAHKTLPLPTFVKIKNLDNGKTVIVKVNDRGPFHGDRIIDLSYAAASKLGILAKGTGHVEIEAIDPTIKEEHEPVLKQLGPSKKQQRGQYLQIAAFKHEVNAKKLATQLKKININHPIEIRASHAKSKQKQSKMYLVHVGPLKDAAIEQVRKKLSANKLPKPIAFHIK